MFIPIKVMFISKLRAINRKIGNSHLIILYHFLFPLKDLCCSIQYLQLAPQPLNSSNKRNHPTKSDPVDLVNCLNQSRSSESWQFISVWCGIVSTKGRSVARNSLCGSFQLSWFLTMQCSWPYPRRMKNRKNVQIYAQIII